MQLATSDSREGHEAMSIDHGHLQGFLADVRRVRLVASMQLSPQQRQRRQATPALVMVTAAMETQGWQCSCRYRSAWVVAPMATG
jgi:hypothetical protein